MSFPPPETEPCALSSEQPGLDKSRLCFVHQRNPTDANQPAIFRRLTCIHHTAKLELCLCLLPQFVRICVFQRELLFILVKVIYV